MRAAWLVLAALGPLLGGCGQKRLLAAIVPSVQTYPAQPQTDVFGWVLRARVAEDLGDNAEADRAWQWAVRLGDTDPWAWVGRAGFLERVGRTDEALAAYRQALVHDPNLARAHLGIGRIDVIRGDDAAAAPELKLAADAGLPEALHLLGRLRLRAGDKDGARAVYEAWAKLPVTVVGEHLDRGRLGLAVGEPAQAIDDLVAALRDGQGGPETAEVLARTARSTCRIGPAWRWAVETRLGDREDPHWRAVAVTIGQSARDPDLLEEALGPGEGLDPVMVGNRVDLLTAAGRPEQALAVLDEAQKAHPEDVALLLRRAAVLAGMGKDAQALVVLAKVPSGDRYAPGAARQAAEVHLSQGDPKAALAALAAVHSTSWDITRVRADALAAEGHRDQAEQVLLHGHATPAERWRQVGRLRSSLGDNAGALQAFAKAGNDPRALADRARLLAHTGDAAGARTIWEKLVALDPSDASAWEGLAAVSDDPVPALHKALAADPCDVSARLALAATQPPCDAVRTLQAARDAAPRDRRVLDAVATAYHACGVARRASGQGATAALKGLRDVEWTWQVIGDEKAGARVRALLDDLEGP